MIKRILDKYRSLPTQMKAAFWFLVCAFLQRGISAITTPIFTRLMTTDEYGQYSVFSSWMSIVTCFVTLNIYGGVYAQGLVKFEAERDRFASAFQGLLFTLSVAWLVIYLFFHSYVDRLFDLTGPQTMLMILIIWLDGVYQLWAQEQRVAYKYKVLVIFTLLYSVANPLIGILLIRMAKDKVTARVLGIAVAAIVSYGWMFLHQVRKGKCFFSRRIWKYALTLALPLIPHYLSQMILNSSDRIMIGKMTGTADAGIYSLAYSVSLIMTVFNSSLLSTVEPWIYQKIKNKEFKHLPPVAYASFTFIAALNLLLIAFAPEIIRIFAPTSYYDAIWVIPPVTMSVYFMFMYSFYALFEFYYEKTQYIATATVVGAVINVITNYIFIGLFGYIAAGYTTLACYIIYVLMHYYAMRKICRDELGELQVYNMKIILLISIAFVGLGFTFMATYITPILRYGLVTFLVVAAVLKRKNIEKMEKHILITRKE